MLRQLDPLSTGLDDTMIKNTTAAGSPSMLGLQTFTNTGCATLVLAAVGYCIFSAQGSKSHWVGKWPGWDSGKLACLVYWAVPGLFGCRYRLGFGGCLKAKLLKVDGRHMLAEKAGSHSLLFFLVPPTEDFQLTLHFT